MITDPQQHICKAMSVVHIDTRTHTADPPMGSSLISDPHQMLPFTVCSSENGLMASHPTGQLLRQPLSQPFNDTSTHSSTRSELASHSANLSTLPNPETKTFQPLSCRHPPTNRVRTIIFLPLHACITPWTRVSAVSYGVTIQANTGCQCVNILLSIPTRGSVKKLLEGNTKLQP